MKRIFLLVGFIFIVVICVTPAAAQSDSRPTYEIYAIRYAEIPDFPVAGLVKGADPARKDKNGMTALMRADFKGHAEAADLLRDIERQDSH